MSPETGTAPPHATGPSGPAPGDHRLVRLTLTVNGRPVHLTVPARLTLADLLRDQLGLTGTHLGCEHGVCGACTVFLDGRSVRSCLTLAAQADGTEVTTVEGLGEHPTTARLRSCFRRHHALQCGFCTPGMLVTATELLDEHPQGLTERAVREGLTGNICRCTGYQGIVRAVLEAGSTDSTTTDHQEDPA